MAAKLADVAGHPRRGVSDEFSNHIRAAGITLFRRAGGDLRVAQQLAAHADVKTTVLCDRSGEHVQRAEVERVQP